MQLTNELADRNADLTTVTIRPYQPGDEKEVVALWNRCLPRDEISLTIFRRKIILDPNFDPHACITAVAGNKVVGFTLGICRRYPYYDLGLEPGKGWITVFFVHPDYRRQGVATRMLQSTEESLTARSVRQIIVSDYTPNYFIPGVDLDAYAAGHLFLKARGYKKSENMYGMGRSLMDFEVPAEMGDLSNKLLQAGFQVKLFQPEYTLQALEFLRKHYPGDLFKVALERLTEDPECDEILVALKGEQVIGFSHFLDERFGPFGIDP